MIKDRKIASYRVRYIKVIEDLTEIAQMKPEEQYMHKLMKTVIFQDFETALDGMIEDFHVTNDNQR